MWQKQSMTLKERLTRILQNRKDTCKHVVLFKLNCKS